MFSFVNKKVLLIGCAMVGTTAAAVYLYKRWTAREEAVQEPEENHDQATADQEVPGKIEQETLVEGTAAPDGTGNQVDVSKKESEGAPRKPTFGGMKKGFLL